MNESTRSLCMQALTVLILAILIFSSACEAIPITPPPKTQAPGLVQTLAIQTMLANSSMANLVYTPTPPPATNTPLSTTTSLPTLTLRPTYTPLPPVTLESSSVITPTTPPKAYFPDGSEVPCNAAEFIKDVTVPDDMPIHPGVRFTKIWEMKNIGTCAWTTRYSLVLIWGEPMGTKPPILLQKIVSPGETAELAVNMVSPYLPLCFQGSWMLQDESGNRFGTGYKFQQFFWVSISVELPGLKGISFG
jgi:hypothetical protein